ncbi:MAG: hypothetical protein IID44_16190 [Planctomycetes bacterium]|nr:hypothetical protein [Planctomycetota bacterium]
MDDRLGAELPFVSSRRNGTLWAADPRTLEESGAMTQTDFDKSTRFFRSFTATTMPVVPVDEVDASHTRHLVSFYAADFDENGRLTRCRKFLNVEDDEAINLDLVFDDHYTYSTDGILESRILVRADGNEVRWIFDASNEAGRWRDVSLAQDQLTELERRVMSDVRATDLCGNELAVSTVRDYLTSAEQVLRVATQDPRSALLLLIPGSGDEWIQLHSARDAISSLEDIELVLMPHLLEFGSPIVCANLNELKDDLAEGRRFLIDHQIRALAAHPVCVKDDETTAVGVIVMLAFRDWPQASSEQVMSLLKRITVFVELLIEIGRRDVPFQPAKDASNPHQE